MERRQEPRRATNLPARVLIDGSARACVIADISQMGARLDFGASSIELPSKFILDMTPDGRVLRMCELRHRTGQTAGVEFIPASMATLRRYIADTGTQSNVAPIGVSEKFTIE